MVAHFDDLARGRGSVDVHIEEGHEDAHFQSPLFQESILHALSHMDDFAVCWREDGVLEGRYFSLRISKEKGDEKGEENSQACPYPPSHPGKKKAEDPEWDQKGKSLFGNGPSILRRQSYAFFSQLIMERNLSPMATMGCSASIFLKAMKTGLPA